MKIIHPRADFPTGSHQSSIAPALSKVKELQGRFITAPLNKLKASDTCNKLSQLPWKKVAIAATIALSGGLVIYALGYEAQDPIIAAKQAEEAANEKLCDGIGMPSTYEAFVDEMSEKITLERNAFSYGITGDLYDKIVSCTNKCRSYEWKTESCNKMKAAFESFSTDCNKEEVKTQFAQNYMDAAHPAVKAFTLASRHCLLNEGCVF